MRILVYGAGKTGTTAVYYAYKNAIPGIAHVFEPADLSKIETDKYPSLLVKSLAVMKHAQDAPYFSNYDKKVLIVRHPFDRLVSYVLYAPNNGHGFFDDRKMESYIDLLKRKLSSPGSISFQEIVGVVGSYQPSASGMHAPLKTLEVIANNHPDFHLLRYEDFVDGKLEDLNRYSGLVLQSDPEISGNEQKVVRSKAYGDWHKWFLPQDVEYFRDIYAGYLDRFGYDTTLRAAEPLSEDTSVRYSIKVGNEGRRVRWLPEYVPGEINMTTEGLQYQHAKYAMMHKNVEQAEQLVDKVLASNARIAGFHHLRSRLLTRRGDHAGAAAALRQAIEIIPDEPQFHELLSVALQKMGNKTEADAAGTAARELQEKATG